MLEGGVTVVIARSVTTKQSLKGFEKHEIATVGPTSR